MAKKKIKKAILAGLTAYAAAKMLGKGKLTAEQAAAGENIIPKKKPYAHELEKYISSKKPEHLGDTGKSMDYMLKKPWWKFWKEGGSISAPVWKKHGGSIRTEHARMGKMVFFLGMMFSPAAACSAVSFPLPSILDAAYAVKPARIAFFSFFFAMIYISFV